MASIALVAALCAAHHSPSATMRSVVYAADDTDFPNPERGFSRSKGSGAQARAAGLSLIHVYFRLDAFRGSALPQTFIDDISRRLAEARASGVKVVPRFTYNFQKEPFHAGVDNDAPLPRVLEHLNQLAPALRDNADVIAFMEAGFVGAWGEWHDSTSGLTDVAAERTILRRLLDILPKSRSIVLRYEGDKRAVFGRDTPLMASEAFSGSSVSRVGHHNDCFLASDTDWGSYRPTPQRSIAAAKAYLSAENRFVPQGGETCNDAADAKPYIGCTNALKELSTQHWSQLNADYHPAVLALWKRQGCYSEISRRLGYRFRLLRSAYAPTVVGGGTLRAKIILGNDGFAAPYNPRPLELVLRGSAGEAVRLHLPQDPRRWLPGAPITLDVVVRLPSGMPSGTYGAYLALPDPEPRLRGRADYAIRLANQGSWNPATGENDLGWRLRVD
ncbi:MAG: DUF4832 domain-containing protein [Sphingomonas sp.]|nr:DUF4832 domain-containing protein [Sphingomonas sp.]